MNSELNISKTIFGYGIVVFPLFLLIGPLFSEIFFNINYFLLNFFDHKRKQI